MQATERSSAQVAGDRYKASRTRVSLYKRFVCSFGDYALINPILGTTHLRNPPICILQSVLRNVWFPPDPLSL